MCKNTEIIKLNLTWTLHVYLIECFKNYFSTDLLPDGKI